MKYLFILFLTSKLFAQSIDMIEASDTIFMYIQANQKLDNLHVTVGNHLIDQYQITDIQGKTISISSISAKNLKQQPINSLSIKRKLLLTPKIKSKTIDLAFISKNGLGETFIGLLKVHEKRKVIYIFNDADLKRRNIKLRKVLVDYSAFVEM